MQIIEDLAAQKTAWVKDFVETQKNKTKPKLITVEDYIKKFKK